MWIWLIIAILIGLIVLLLCNQPNLKETFMTTPKNINAVCIYAAYNLDEHDKTFILRYSEDIPFNIINNGDLTPSAKELENKHNIKIYQRENNGYDAGAWKYAINNINLSKYDVVIFMNNSCIYGCDLLRLCEHAIDYDLYSYGFSYELYKRPYNTPHLHAYMFFVNKRLYNSPEFKAFWNDISETDGNHDTSVDKNEYRLKSYFEGHNFKVGAHRFFDVEDTYKFTKTDKYNTEIIKKRETKKYPEKINIFKEGLNSNKAKRY